MIDIFIHVKNINLKKMKTKNLKKYIIFVQMQFNK